MNALKKLTMVAVAVMFIMSLAAMAAAPAAEKTTAKETATEAATLANLGKAFNGESNAKARYEAFAKKADEEGFPGVASMFRAAAKAESLHADKLETLIKKMGGTATLVAVAPEVKTTKENIEAAIKGETEEYTTMYPEFAKTAEAEKNTAAAKLFTRNGKVENTHATLYKDVLAKIDEMKKAKVDYQVCPVCGYTTAASADVKKCPVCAEPKKKFTDVN